MLERYRRAGKHRSTGGRARVTRRFRTIELVDARTLVAHELTPDALDAGRGPRGRYVALCGADVLPAAMEEPGRASCRWCTAKIPTQRSGASR